MINIKETVKDHYTALEFMCDGLLRQNKRNHFHVDMEFFGVYKAGVCYGCAATSTIQQITNKLFKGGEISSRKSRANYLRFNREELTLFEKSIDEARQGDLLPLMMFFGEIPDKNTEVQWDLCTDNWKQQLPVIRKYIRDGRKNND